MKKTVVVLLSLVFIYCSLSIGYAEDLNLSALSFSELSDLKQKIDYEYNSRTEAKPFKLFEGEYVAGVDIAPGRYYMACVEADDDNYTTRMHIYKDRAQYDSRPSGRYGEYLSDSYFGIGDEPKSIYLEANNFLLLQNGSLLISPQPFNPSDFYTYVLPEGTIVPVGAYEVGESGDIPAGKYSIFAGTVSGGDLKIYYTKEKYSSDGSWHLGYDKHYELDASKSATPETIILEEGNVLLIEKDVVMKKQKKLLFD